MLINGPELFLLPGLFCIFKYSVLDVIYIDDFLVAFF
jgi:hypothetical protein